MYYLLPDTLLFTPRVLKENRLTINLIKRQKKKNTYLSALWNNTFGISLTVAKAGSNLVKYLQLCNILVVCLFYYCELYDQGVVLIMNLSSNEKRMYSNQ